MNKSFTLILMIFLHILDDFVLQKQGCLADLKQKEFWEKNAPDKRYRYDYIWALIVHSFSWAFMVMLPIAYLQNFAISGGFLMMFTWNIIIHARVDNKKANAHVINLWGDQLCHLTQILCTWLILS